MRRKRAIILFACQSFAWFTGKDEVTNRLTANADYGVSIVESFVPPKNWLPGQEINKDVYAVNTGTVDAFVKETISGVLNYTYEQVVDTWTADCVTLDDKTITAIDGATTDEAGGFLAWTDAKVPTTTIDGKYAAESEVNVTATDGAATEPVSITFTKKYTVGTKEYYEASDGKLYTIDDGVYTPTDKEATTEDLPYSTGPVNSARIVDAAASQGDSATNTVNGNTVDENGDLAPEPGVKPKRWTPPVDGIYIFRRAIDTKAADTSEGAAAGATKTVYQYAGYKFVKGNGTAENPDKYYEIVIGDKEKANYPTDGENHENALTAPFAEWNFDINASSEDIPDITIDENSAIIAGTPKVRYVKEYEVKNANALFTYNPDDAEHGNVATLTANYVPNLTGTGDVSDALAALNADNEALERARTAVTTAQTNLQTLSNTAYEKSAAASDAETEYENALGAYNTALSRYNHTEYAYDLANSMATATENLYKAADDRAIFQAQYEAAEQAMKDAWSDAITDPATPATINSVSGKAANMLTTYKSVFDMGGTAAEGNQLGDNSPVSFKKLFGDTSNAPTEGTSLAKKINDLYTQYYDSSLGAMENQRFGSMKSNMDKMHTLWGEMVNLLATGTAAVGDPGDANYVPANPGIIANMNRLKDGAAGNVDGGVDDVEAALIRTQLAADLATLKQKMSDYQRAYAKLADAAVEAGEAALTGAVVGSAVAAVASTKTAADELFDVGFRTPTAGDKDLEQLLKDYESAYKTWHDMSNTTETDPAAGQPVSTVGQANKAWKNAVDAYNNAITTAESTYTTNIEKTQPTLNDYFRITNDDDKYLTDQTAGIVGDAQNKGYLSNVSSANDEDKISTENGKFDTATNGYPDYKLYTIPSGVATAKTGGGYEVKPYDANDTTHTGKQRVSPATSTYTQIGIDADHKEAVNGAAPTALTVDALKGKLDTATTDLYGGANNTAENATDGSKYKKWTAAKAAEASANAALATAQNTVDNATTTLQNLQGRVDEAQAAYDEALGKGSPINIIIKLADDADNLGWTYDPNHVGTTEESGTRGTEANFYLNEVLKGGETSTKLIDSVYLDEHTTPKAYKTLVFDLNVGMDSVQVTYDADQREYATDAVDADPDFQMKATTIKGSNEVEWTAE